MGMGSSGGRGEVTSDINVTPMADVMLVLLIIFMVITPMLQKGQSVELAKTRNPIDMKKPIVTIPSLLPSPVTANSIWDRTRSTLMTSLRK